MSRHTPRPASCMNPGCGKTWPTDPVLAVECPDCKQPAGSRCKKPSGHDFPGGGFHASRDIAADRAGAYGVCPLGICGLAAKEAREAARTKTQPDLFQSGPTTETAHVGL